MVIHEVCVIDKNRCEVQLLALLLSTVLGLDFNKTEERKLKCRSNRAIANEVLSLIDLSSLPNQGSSCNVFTR